MKKKDIFNGYPLEVWNNFLNTHNAGLSLIKKREKQRTGLFLYHQYFFIRPVFSGICRERQASLIFVSAVGISLSRGFPCP